MSRTTKHLQSGLSVESQKGAVCQQCHDFRVRFGWGHDLDQAEDLEITNFGPGGAHPPNHFTFSLFSPLFYIIPCPSNPCSPFIDVAMAITIVVNRWDNIEIGFVYYSIGMAVHNMGAWVSR